MNKLLTKKAYLLSKQFHAGQTDLSGKDYFSNHIKFVFKHVGGYNSNPPELGIVALLHDIVEDTPVKIRDIEVLFGDKVAKAVHLLTRTGESTKIDYSYLSKIKSNPLARRVKIADLTHNSDITRIPNPKMVDFERLEKYKESLVYLK